MNKKLTSYFVKGKSFLSPKIHFLIKFFLIRTNIDLISRKLDLTCGYKSNANSFTETTLTTIKLLNNRVHQFPQIHDSLSLEKPVCFQSTQCIL